MTYNILEKGNLELVADDPGELENAETIEELLERLLANSELQWLGPEVCGDLTDAPMLAILSYLDVEHEAVLGDGYVSAGCWDGKHWSYKVAQRWAWMDYQVSDLLEHLRKHGRAILVGGSPWAEETTSPTPE